MGSKLKHAPKEGVAGSTEDLPDIEFWPQLDFEAELLQSVDWLDHSGLGHQQLANPGSEAKAQIHLEHATMLPANMQGDAESRIKEAIQSLNQITGVDLPEEPQGHEV